jgi:hypothetical protein
LVSSLCGPPYLPRIAYTKGGFTLGWGPRPEELQNQTILLVKSNILDPKHLYRGMVHGMKPRSGNNVASLLCQISVESAPNFRVGLH